MRKKTSIMTFTVLLLLTLSVLFLLSGCKKGNDLAGVDRSAASDVLRSPGTATPVITPSTSPVSPESLTDKQKRDMVWSGTDNLFGQIPEKIYIFYIELNGVGKLIWAEKDSNPGGGGFDLFDVFNGEFLFHVSIPIEEEAKVTPADFPQYIDEVNEMLRDYNIVAAGKLLEISDLYSKNNIDSAKTEDLYEVLITYFYKTSSSFHVSSKEVLLDAFIDVTPPQYILPIWKYIPNAVTPSSYFNPPSPTPIPTPELTLEQKELLLGIGKESSAYPVDDIDVYHYILDGHTYRIWTVAFGNREKSKNSNGKYVLDVYDIFTLQYLFSIGLPNNGVDIDGQGFSPTQYVDFLFETNPALKGVRLVLSFGLVTGSRTYKQEYIEYNSNSILDSFCESFSISSTKEQREATSNTMLSVDMQKEIFLDSTPQEEILPYWVYTPGAQIPEELKGIYSEADYPPAPAE